MSIEAVRAWVSGGDSTTEAEDRAAIGELFSLMSRLAGVDRDGLYSGLRDASIVLEEARAIVGLYDWLKAQQPPAVARDVVGVPEARKRELAALARTNKIQAIKQLRNETGLSLTDAKDAIEAWMTRYPDETTPQPAQTFAVGDRVASVDGMVTFIGDQRILPVGGRGTITHIAKEENEQPYRVVWDCGDCWHHSADQLRRVDAPTQPATPLIDELRMQVRMLRADTARQLVVELLSSAAVRDAVLGCNESAWRIIHAMREAARGVELTDNEVGKALAEYNALTGYVDPTRKALEAKRDALRAQLEQLERDLAA